MPITELVSNAETLTLTIRAEYPVPLERLWNAYSDPRQLERFWGPEQWPATFTRHDMAEGGESRYFMTGPDGTRVNGWWRLTSIKPLSHIAFEDGFADEAGVPNADMPSMQVDVRFERTAEGSRFTNVTTFPSVEAMQELVEMGMMEGMKSAIGQLDTILADLATFASSLATDAQLLSDTQVRVSRVIRGSVADVWRAHHEPELMQQWMLGPDGWSMPVCDVAQNVGDQFRYEWASDDGTQRFGFDGELLESAPPYREVTTEVMIGTDGPGARNELTLVPVQDGTLLSIVITYPSKEVRDMVLGTGMTQGMEASYARLEREVLAA